MTGVPITRRQVVLGSVVLFLVTLMTVAGDYASWWGSWGETSATLETSTLLTYPAVAAIAAWTTSGSRRNRYQWMLDSAARQRHSVHLRVVATQAASASVGFLVVALMAGIATATQATFGTFPIIDLFTIVAGFFAASGLGVLLATLVPPALAPVCAVATVYAVGAFADTSRPSLRPLAGLIVADGRDRTYLSAATWMLGLRGMWLLAVAFLLVALAARASSKAWLPFAAACLTAVPLLLVGDAGMTVDEAAARPVCHHPRPSVTVCLSAALDHTYPSVWSALEPELDLLSGLAGQWRLAESAVADQLNASFRDGTITVPFEIVNGTDSSAHVADREDLQAQFSATLLQGLCGSGGDYTGRRPVATPEDVIESWLLSELDIPLDGHEPEDPHLSSKWLDYTAMERFRAHWDSRTATQRRAWFRAHAQDVVHCQLSNVEVMTP